MKGFLEVVRADHKNHEFVNIAHIVSMSGSDILTDAIANIRGDINPYIIKTAHTHKELVEMFNKAIEESNL